MSEVKKTQSKIIEFLTRIYWWKLFVFIFSITFVAAIIPMIWVWFLGELSLFEQGTIISLWFVVMTVWKFLKRLGLKPQKNEPFDPVNVSMSLDGKRLRYEVLDKEKSVIK